ELAPIHRAVELKYPYSGVAGIIDAIVIPANIAITGTEPIDESDRRSESGTALPRRPTIHEVCLPHPFKWPAFMASTDRARQKTAFLYRLARAHLLGINGPEIRRQISRSILFSNREEEGGTG